MKKIIAIILIILFPATVTVYAQIFRSDEIHNHESSNNSTMEYSYESSDDYSGGIFRTDAEEPGLTPPDASEGIGEEGEADAPLNGGLGFLVVCSVAFGVVKLLLHKNANNK